MNRVAKELGPAHTVFVHVLLADELRKVSQMSEFIRSGLAGLGEVLAILSDGVEVRHPRFVDVHIVLYVELFDSCAHGHPSKGRVRTNPHPPVNQLPVMVRSRMAASGFSSRTTRVTSVRICHCLASPTVAICSDSNGRSWPRATLS